MGNVKVTCFFGGTELRLVGSSSSPGSMLDDPLLLSFEVAE
jgi:hypothetical protein